MKKKMYILTLSCSAILMFLVGWATAIPKPIQEAAPVSLTKEYTSMAQMIKDTPYIVEVEVKTNPETIDYDGVLFSKNQVKIVEVLKGSLELGEIIILDNGGEYQGKEYAIGGMPLLHEGDKYLLFLYEYKGPVTNDKAYMIKGVWQGKIKMDAFGQLDYVGPHDESHDLQEELKKSKKLNNIKTLIHNLKQTE